MLLFKEDRFLFLLSKIKPQKERIGGGERGEGERGQKRERGEGEKGGGRKGGENHT